MGPAPGDAGEDAQGDGSGSVSKETTSALASAKELDKDPLIVPEKDGDNREGDSVGQEAHEQKERGQASAEAGKVKGTDRHQGSETMGLPWGLRPQRDDKGVTVTTMISFS